MGKKGSKKKGGKKGKKGGVAPDGTVHQNLTTRPALPENYELCRLLTVLGAYMSLSLVSFVATYTEWLEFVNKDFKEKFGVTTNETVLEDVTNSQLGDEKVNFVSSIDSATYRWTVQAILPQLHVLPSQRAG